MPRACACRKFLHACHIACDVLSGETSEGLLCAQRTYGNAQGLKWMVYWRLFYLACSELFSYNSGEEWYVSHYLFKKR